MAADAVAAPRNRSGRVGVAARGGNATESVQNHDSHFIWLRWKKDERKMKGKTCNKIVTKNVSQNKIFTNCHFSITMKKFNKINYLISALGLNYC
jgi:hypothetical protein